MGALQELHNIGKVAEALLIDVGIDTPEKLVNLGSKESFFRIRLQDPTVCLHLLYGLEGAIQGIRDSGLSIEIKQDLKTFYKKL